MRCQLWRHKPETPQRPHDSFLLGILLCHCAYVGLADLGSSVRSSLQESPQHGMRPKRQKAHSRRMKKPKRTALARLVALQTFGDMAAALCTTDLGRKQCTMCAYLDVREREELDAWEEKNSEVIERWLRYRKCHLFRTVSVGGCGHGVSCHGKRRLGAACEPKFT